MLMPQIRKKITESADYSQSPLGAPSFQHTAVKTIYPRGVSTLTERQALSWQLGLLNKFCLWQVHPCFKELPRNLHSYIEGGLC